MGRLAGAISPHSDMWPLPVPWASLKYGGPDPRVSIHRQGGREEDGWEGSQQQLHDLTPEDMQKGKVILQENTSDGRARLSLENKICHTDLPSGTADAQVPPGKCHRFLSHLPAGNYAPTVYQAWAHMLQFISPNPVVLPRESRMNSPFPKENTGVFLGLRTQACLLHWKSWAPEHQATPHLTVGLLFAPFAMNRSRSPA